MSLASGQVREMGALRLDGVPLLDPVVAELARPYLSIRSASVRGSLPDGSVLISTRFGEASQVHLVEAPLGARTQLTFFAESVDASGVDPARPFDGLYLQMDRGGDENGQVSWLDRRSGRVTLLSDGTSRNVDMAVSRAGNRVYFFSTGRNGVDTDLWEVTDQDPASRRMVRQLEGSWAMKAESPDGQKLVLVRTISALDERLWLLDRAAGTFEDLFPGQKPQRVGGAAFSADGASLWFTGDAGGEYQALSRMGLATRAVEVVALPQAPDAPWDVEHVAISDDGRWIAWTRSVAGRAELWIAKPGREDRARRIELPTGVLGSVGFDRWRPRLLLGLSTKDSEQDVWEVDPRRGALVRWTRSETGGLDPAGFVEPTLVSWPSFDGRPIYGWLTRPPGQERVPVVVAIHGGPEAQARPWFSARNQLYVRELGVAVLEPNVRGSTGYGRTFATLDDGRLRFDAVKDIGALLDWIATQPGLDPGRVAVTGGSYGGFMVLASLVEHGERLRCGADMVGISSFATFLRNTAPYRRDLRRVEYGDERDPEMLAWMEATAPLANADRIRRPLLVGQGRNDPRVPWTEAEQIVARVRQLGGEAWYVLAEDEGHGFSRRSNADVWGTVQAMFLRRCLGLDGPGASP